MEAQTDTPSGNLPVVATPCAIESCAEPAVAQFGTQSFCMEHFAIRSIREIESRNHDFRNQWADAVATSSFREFLAGCATQVKDLVESEQTSQAPGKERLLDILLLISQLNQRLRRSPRTPASVPLWLRREDPGQTWEEETWTSSISRHGAGLICRHRVEPGRTVFLCRKDRGGRATARVVYSRFDSLGDRQIGVEILDREDFWDKSELGSAPNPPTAPKTAERAETPAPATIHADIEIEVAGRTAVYKQVPLQLETQGTEAHASATIPASLADFEISPAALPEVAGASQVPLRIDIRWRNEK